MMSYYKNCFPGPYNLLQTGSNLVLIISISYNPKAALILFGDLLNTLERSRTLLQMSLLY